MAATNARDRYPLGTLIWAINLQVQYDLDPHADRLDDRRDHELAANAN